jgi:polysaccharide pyruvyl transferase WcaK-like protein
MHDYVGLPSSSVLLNQYRKKFVAKFIKPRQLENNSFIQMTHSLRDRRRMANSLKTLGIKMDSIKSLQPAMKFSHGEQAHLNVLICGWYGTETLGDKAILGGVVKAIESNFDSVSFHIASLESYISAMTIRQMPELKNCEVLTISEALDSIDSMGLVVAGGGPLMAIKELAEILAIFQRAAKAGVPTMIAGCGVGPLNQPFQNEVVGSILNLASCRIFRDQKSLMLAQGLGVDITYDIVAEDPAFTWLCDNIDKNPSTDFRYGTNQDLKLLLGLRDWPSYQYAPGLQADEAQNIKSNFEREFIKGLELLLDRFPNLTIIPFPMCTNHIGGDDRWFYRRLFRNNEKILATLDGQYLGAEVPPSEAITIFQGASAALTMRYHSLIFALASGLPTVSIDYTLGEGKVFSLAEQHNVPQIRLDKANHQSIYDLLSSALTAKGPDQMFMANELKFTRAVNSCVASLSNDKISNSQQ